MTSYAEYINQFRGAKLSGWVKARERLPEINPNISWRFTDCSGCGIGFEKTGFVCKTEFMGQAVHLRLLTPDQIEGIEWYDETLESPSSVPEPDAEKEKLQKENENLTGSLAHMIDQADDLRDRIQQLEAQLQASKVDAEKLKFLFMEHATISVFLDDRAQLLMSESEFIKAIQSIQP